MSSLFIHPAIAGIALAAGLIPVLVHLINRRRYRKVPWAAMSFLLAARKRTAKRIWMEQWLLLAARVAVIVLFGLAVARPYIPSSPLFAFGAARAHRIVVLDNSLSMNAGTGPEESRFDRAQRQAEQLIESFPAADAVSLITTATPAEAVIGHAAYDRRAVRDRLNRVEPSQRAADMPGALSLARDIVRAGDAALGNRLVYVISDLPRRDWLPPAEGAGAPQPPTATAVAARRLIADLPDPARDLTLIRVADEQSPNLAVTRLALESPLVTASLPARIVAEVTNHTSATVRGASLQIRRDNEIIRTESLPPIAAGATQPVAWSMEFSAPGTHIVEAALSTAAADTLALDNIRYLSIEVRQRIPVLLVDGRPGTTPLGGQAGFAAAALGAPLKRDISLTAAAPSGLFIESRVVSMPEFESEALAAYDVVILCNVSRLSSDQWAQLQRHVERGAGLMIFGGDLVQPEHYNRFGFAEGKGLLPGTLLAADDLSGANGTHQGFKLDDRPHPIVAEFAQYPDSGLFLARVDRYLPLDIDADRAQTALRYTNDAPALVLSTHGQGRIALCTTTANLDWNNLPAKGDFVSLMLNTVAFLAPHRGDFRNLVVGDALREPLTPAQSSLPLRITDPHGATSEPRLTADGTGLALIHGPLEQAGTLHAQIGTESRAFAVNLDPQSSDLQTTDDAGLNTALGRAVRIAPDLRAAGAGAADVRTRELAPLMFLLVLALLIIEMYAAMRFGQERSDQ